MPNINDISSADSFPQILCRFEAKFEKTHGCWIWKASTLPLLPYGRFQVVKGFPVLAHRFSFVAYVGQIPDGMMVLHKCDNPRCVNPRHLFLGVHDDNMADKVAKRRQSALPGERHPMAKLREADAIEIFRSKKSGVQLAREFGISPNAVCKIKKGKAWSHVTGRLT